MSAHSFPCTISELRLDKTLTCGQSFRWRESSPGVWMGVFNSKIWKLWQTDTDLYYQVFPSAAEPNDKEKEAEHVKKSLCKEEHTKCEVSIPKQPKVSKASSPDILQSAEKTIKSVRQCSKEDNSLQSHFPISRSEISDMNLELLLKNYFQLHINLEELYKHWSEVDLNFKEVSEEFEGIRMIRQDPVENLFSFICSSNNNISRISKMVESLCQNYGEKVGEVEGTEYFGFPHVSVLAEDEVENELRNMGFGYRAKFINKTAKIISEKQGLDWLYGLREKSYDEAKAELMTLSGVGAKVADCVCLMSMDKTDSIPVDTHVWQIAKHYIPKLHQTKSLTDKLYNEIGDYFRDLWGPYAGWAHSVLFAADLKKFKDQVSTSPKYRKVQAKPFKQTSTAIKDQRKRKLE